MNDRVVGDISRSFTVAEIDLEPIPTTQSLTVFEGRYWSLQTFHSCFHIVAVFDKISNLVTTAKDHQRLYGNQALVSQQIAVSICVSAYYIPACYKVGLKVIKFIRKIQKKREEAFSALNVKFLYDHSQERKPFCLNTSA